MKCVCVYEFVFLSIFFAVFFFDLINWYHGWKCKPEWYPFLFPLYFNIEDEYLYLFSFWLDHYINCRVIYLILSCVGFCIMFCLAFWCVWVCVCVRVYVIMKFIVSMVCGLCNLADAGVPFNCWLSLCWLDLFVFISFFLHFLFLNKLFDSNSAIKLATKYDSCYSILHFIFRHCPWWKSRKRKTKKLSIPLIR